MAPRSVDIYEDKLPKNGEVVAPAGDVVSIGSGEGNVNQENPTGRNSSVFGGIANLTNTIIGTGVLALPYAFAQCGWVVALILMAFSLAGSVLTIHFYSKCCHRVGGENTSYGGVFKEAFPRLGWLGDLSVVFMCIGACISYLMVAGDLLPQFVEQVAGSAVAADSFLYNRLFWIAIVFAVVGAPLACMPNIDRLKFTSALAIVAVLYVMVVVFLFFVSPSATFDACYGKNAATCRGAIQAVGSDGLGVLRALPMFIFAFACQVNIPAIYNVMKKANVKSMDMVGGGSITLVGVVYMAFGLCGLLTYGTNVTPNILTDYPITPVVSVARVMLAFVVSVSYPVLFHPTRDALVNLALQAIVATGKGDFVSGPRGHATRPVYWTCTVVLLATTLAVAMTVTNLGLVFGILGATSCTMTAFIIPAITYLKMFVYNDASVDAEKGWAPPSESKWDGVKKYSAWFITVFGVIFMPVAVVVMFV